MILVTMAICIALFIVGILLDVKYGHYELGNGIIVISVIVFIIATIVLVCLCCSVSSAKTLDERIAMYEEENAKIEEQIAAVVSNYQIYESDIFKNTTPESAITLVALYPELKSDTLVQSQIDLYVKNREEIISLKEKKINATVSRWWLYFGK